MARFPDGTVCHFIYVGTIDQVTMEPRPEPNQDRPWERTVGKPCRIHSIVPVEIWTAYGRGFFWEGRACMHCHHITHGLDPFDDRKVPGSGIPVRETRCDGNPQWVDEILKAEAQDDPDSDRSG